MYKPERPFGKAVLGKADKLKTVRSVLRAATIISDATLVAVSEFDAGLGQTEAAASCLSDGRGCNVLEPGSAVVLRALGESLR